MRLLAKERQLKQFQPITFLIRYKVMAYLMHSSLTMTVIAIHVQTAQMFVGFQIAFRVGVAAVAAIHRGLHHHRWPVTFVIMILAFLLHLFHFYLGSVSLVA